MKKVSQWKDRRFVIIAVLVFTLLVLVGYFIVTLMVYPSVLPQQAINAIPEVGGATRGQKVLVFSPHPDDETIGVGGFIADSVEKGAEVRIVLVTNGNRHHNEAVRYAEFRAAAGVLGVKESSLVFLNFHDGTLYQQSKSLLYERFKEQIDAWAPDVLVYPCEQDFHPDHSTTAIVIDRVLQSESGRIKKLQYLVHYGWYYPRPKKLAPNMYLLPPAHLKLDDWQKVLLSQSLEALKEEAIYSYRSQLRDPILTQLLLSNIRRNELLLAR